MTDGGSALPGPEPVYTEIAEDAEGIQQAGRLRYVGALAGAVWVEPDVPAGWRGRAELRRA